jgi:hypothetical protein
VRLPPSTKNIKKTKISQKSIQKTFNKHQKEPDTGKERPQVKLRSGFYLWLKK